MSQYDQSSRPSDRQRNRSDYLHDDYLRNDDVLRNDNLHDDYLRHDYSPNDNARDENFYAGNSRDDGFSRSARYAQDFNRSRFSRRFSQDGFDRDQRYEPTPYQEDEGYRDETWEQNRPRSQGAFGLKTNPTYSPRQRSYNQPRQSNNPGRSSADNYQGPQYRMREYDPTENWMEYQQNLGYQGGRDSGNYSNYEAANSLRSYGAGSHGSLQGARPDYRDSNYSDIGYGEQRYGQSRGGRPTWQDSSAWPSRGRNDYSFAQGGEGGENFRGRAPKGYERSDERVREDICERLTHDSQVDASDITVSVKNGVVTLEGSIGDRNQKHRAEDLADACSGVKDVQNRLNVTRGGRDIFGKANTEMDAGSIQQPMTKQ